MGATQVISKENDMKELLSLAEEEKTGMVEMSHLERCLLIETIKEKAFGELDFGEEVTQGKVKLVKRVTGNVSIFFGQN